MNWLPVHRLRPPPSFHEVTLARSPQFMNFLGDMISLESQVCHVPRRNQRPFSPLPIQTVPAPQLIPFDFACPE
eukprot:2817874-Rhodomonas_salina.2